MNFAPVLAEAKAAFDGDGIRFALAGGVAIAVYGIHRATLDLDFVVPMDEANAAVRALERIGFGTVRRSAGFSNHLRALDTERIDLLFVEGSTSIALFSRTTRHAIFDEEPIEVVHPEHLVAMKLFALKQNPSRLAIDLEDVRALLLKGLVDSSVVSGYLDRYGLEEYRKPLSLIP